MLMFNYKQKQKKETKEMKKMEVLSGKVGSGKSRTLLSKIKKLGEQNKKVFAVDLECNKEDLIHLEGVDLKAFDSVETMLDYISSEKIETKNVVLVVDNGSINIDSSNIASLTELNFEQTIVTLQLNRSAESDEKSKEKVVKTVSLRWGLEDPDINVDFIARPPKEI